MATGGRQCFWNDADRELFLSTRGEACQRTDWQVPAYDFLGNHFHPVVDAESPGYLRTACEHTMTTSAAGDRPSDAWFRTTHWSVVLTAGRTDTSRARPALESLCLVYWRPLYAYVRRRGFSPHDAADLTQEFFYRLLERQSLAQVDPAKGRFRSFLREVIADTVTEPGEIEDEFRYLLRALAGR